MESSVDAVRLDARKLLGFKIIAGSGASIALRSPKIGGKGCPGIEAQSAACAKPGSPTA